MRQCDTPGCSTLTFGEICLGCEQKKAGVQRSFPLGRPFSPAVADGSAPEPEHDSAAAVATRAT